MKKIIFSLLIGLAVILVIACSEDFLEKEPKGTLGKSAETAMGEDVSRLLIAAYSGLDMNVDAGGGWYPRHSSNNWILGDARTDDAHKGSHSEDQIHIIEAETYDVSVTNDISKGEWRRGYANIQRTNDVINFANNAVNNDPNFTEEDKNHAIAEARFLRAHYYFNLRVFFGKIPWIDESTVDYYVNNDELTDIWSKIEEDLQFASSHLLTKSEQTDVGRATKGAAQTYLARVHMQQGDFTAAKPILDEIISSGEYSLTDDFEANYRVESENNSESIFQIQHTLDEQTGGENANWGLALVGPSAVYSCCGFYQPTIDLVNAYKTDEDGLPLIDTYRDTEFNNPLDVTYSKIINLSTDPYDPEKVYDTTGIYVSYMNPDEPYLDHIYRSINLDAAGDSIIGVDPLTGTDNWELVWVEPSKSFNIDPRLDLTVGRRGVPYMDWGNHPGQSWIREQTSAGPYSPKKYLYTKAEQEAGYARTTGWHKANNAINYNLLRYAEVLLWAAEVEVEIGDLEKARQYVNMIRERAANSDYWVKENDGSGDAANYVIGTYTEPWADQNAARKAVRFERRLETAMEGKRWFDLVRWDVAAQTLNDWLQYETQYLAPISKLHNAVFNEGTDDLLPIHQDILDASAVAGQPTLDQNDGY